jgi:eukaryotic-like serine/threonine-protein kinase
MDDPETRDREPNGTEEPEPGAFLMRAGPEGSPEAIGTSLAGAVGPGQAPLDGVLGAEGPTTAIDTKDATLTPRLSANPTPQPMPVIPGYRVEGELGRGGMGVVYRARQVRLNRPVAVKMILAGRHAGAEAAARFLAEAEAVAKLQHPNMGFPE